MAPLVCVGFVIINKNNGRLKTIFIKPLTLEDLRQRMHHRASESDEQMSIRRNAKAEILREGEFDFVVESMDRDTD